MPDTEIPNTGLVAFVAEYRVGDVSAAPISAVGREISREVGQGMRIRF